MLFLVESEREGRVFPAAPSRESLCRADKGRATLATLATLVCSKSRLATFPRLPPAPEALRLCVCTCDCDSERRGESGGMAAAGVAALDEGVVAVVDD